MLATDAPARSRASCAASRLRAAAGIARTGCNYGHGSGDIVVAFTTAERIAERADAALIVRGTRAGRDRGSSALFDAAAEATEQAIVDALFSAVTVTGRDGHVRRCAARRRARLGEPRA